MEVDTASVCALARRMRAQAEPLARAIAAVPASTETGSPACNAAVMRAASALVDAAGGLAQSLLAQARGLEVVAALYERTGHDVARVADATAERIFGVAP